MWITIVASMTTLAVAFLAQWESLRPDSIRSKRLLRDTEIRDRLRPGKAKESLEIAIEAGVLQMLETRTRTSATIASTIRFVLWLALGLGLMLGGIYAAVASVREGQRPSDWWVSLVAALGGAVAAVLTGSRAKTASANAAREAEIVSEVDLAQRFARWLTSQPDVVEVRTAVGPGQYDMTVERQDGTGQVVEVVTPRDSDRALGMVRELALRASTLALELMIVTTQSSAPRLAAVLADVPHASVWSSTDGVSFEIAASRTAE